MNELNKFEILDLIRSNDIRDLKNNVDDIIAGLNDEKNCYGLQSVKGKCAGLQCSKCPISELYQSKESVIHFFKSLKGYKSNEDIPDSKFEVDEIVNTTDKGWQSSDINWRKALSYKSSDIYSSKIITKKEYSTINKCWWYLLDLGGNWYPESALEKIEVKSEQFKNGDWIVVINSDNSYLKLGDIGQISDFISNSEVFRVDTLTRTNADYVKAEQVRKATQKEIDSVTKPRDPILDLLEEAKRKYPVGTKFKSLISNNTETVRNGIFLQERNGKITGNIIDCSPITGNYIYYNGEWAEIVQEEKEITEYAGLKVGDALKANIISKWAKSDKNRCTLNYSWHKEADVGFHTNRTIESFKVLYGNMAFLVSNTENVYLKADGFKNFMDKMLSKESINQEFPEYYECIGKSDNFTIGKIYKIIHPDNLNICENFIDDYGERNGHSPYNCNYFKPSTKEAFELQEAKNNKPNPISEINRDGYYKVSSQEEYEALCKWLESKGEKAFDKHQVTSEWLYVRYYNENQWELDCEKTDIELQLPDLSEFLPKSKPIKSEESKPTEMYIVKEEDLIGEIRGFPIEIVQKMVERQVEQGNKADVKIFQNDPIVSAEYKGFTWRNSRERGNFWHDVIKDKKFHIFFEKYPKSINPISEPIPTKSSNSTFITVEDLRNKQLYF